MAGAGFSTLLYYTAHAKDPLGTEVNKSTAAIHCHNDVAHALDGNYVKLHYLPVK